MIRAAAISLAACALLLAGPGAAAPVSEEAPKKGYRAPAFEVTTLDGKRVSSRTLRGKVVLLNFWATWCAPCKEELPSLVKLQAAMPATSFTVVALSQDADAKDVTKFLKKHPVNFPNGIDDDGAIARAYQVRGLPATYLIDGDGVIADRVFGPEEWNNAEWRARIEKLIGRAPAK